MATIDELVGAGFEPALCPQSRCAPSVHNDRPGRSTHTNAPRLLDRAGLKPARTNGREACGLMADREVIGKVVVP